MLDRAEGVLARHHCGHRERVPDRCDACGSLAVARYGAGTERIEAGYEGEGLRFQVMEVHACLAAGRLESNVMPLDESLVGAGVLDQIRSQVGIDV